MLLITFKMSKGGICTFILCATQQINKNKTRKQTMKTQDIIKGEAKQKDCYRYVNRGKSECLRIDELCTWPFTDKKMCDLFEVRLLVETEP